MKIIKKTISTPFFARILNVSQTTHTIIKKKKLESINLFHSIDSLCAMDIISKEHSEKTKLGNMLKETNPKEFFTPLESPQKIDVNRHTKNSEITKQIC